ncbi:hypothetical protein BJ508DRAFT_303408 [Ascobolus immersus RN42]|uniref:Uncharacterized protein n=1 Tax=Ascobolus immersus RN42 TaxID=1160509 RepID=A0A3N4ILF8_ASCIM|nr:hypothetical protein BJ508DRAFT_303408 [Ascobolus immersus RN42]
MSEQPSFLRPLRNYELDNQHMLRVLARSPSPRPRSRSDTQHLNLLPAPFAQPRSRLPRLKQADILPGPSLRFYNSSRPAQLNLYIPFPIHSGNELVAVSVIALSTSPMQDSPLLAQRRSSMSREETVIMLRYKLPELLVSTVFDENKGRKVSIHESRFDEVPLPRIVTKDLEREGWAVDSAEFVGATERLAMKYRDVVEKESGVPGVGWPGLRFSRVQKRNGRRSWGNWKRHI